jgi:hypothetical protein
MRPRLTFILLIVFSSVSAQDQFFPFGKVTYSDLGTTYKDTSAAAVVIREYGKSEVDNGNDHNLLFTYHVKIKILNERGLDEANIVIPLRKGDGRSEMLREVRASSFNIENGSMVETKTNTKSVFTENYQYGDLKKLTISNAKVGSVIEYEYVMESPFFVSRFRPWDFQSALPKLETEYWATIPANYRYNISLRGMLTLDKQDTELLKDYFTPGGGMRADCVRYKWGMKNVPAFLEEEYMTSKRNFISSIRFELMQIDHFDGRKDKITKEWRDADVEMRNSEMFGLQLKKGKDVVNAELAKIIQGEPDPLEKAKKIFDYIRHWYRWDESNGKYSIDGIRKAFDKKVGDAGDINLSLVAALRYAGLEADPMILSTRDNGLPTDLFPVLTEFNYVVAKLDMPDRSYFLDATDDFLPFGVLPQRCLNGRGRVMAKKESYWMEIKPADKAKQVLYIDLKMNSTGTLSGTVQYTYVGYKAAEKRYAIYRAGSVDEYIKDRKNTWSRGELKSVSLSNLEEYSKPLVEKLEIELQGLEEISANHFLFNPFFTDRITKNPFRSTERLFPVDFGVPLDESVIINVELPDGMELDDELPERVALALPNSGGKYIFEAMQNGKKITFNSMLLIARPVFSSEEYHFLKELFNRVVSINQTNLVFKKI